MQPKTPTTSRPKPLESILPCSQMARRLRVQVRWLRAEALAGRVPALNVGNTFLFNPAAVEAALLARASRIETPSEEKSDG